MMADSSDDKLSLFRQQVGSVINDVN